MRTRSLVALSAVALAAPAAIACGPGDDCSVTLTCAPPATGGEGGTPSTGGTSEGGSTTNTGGTGGAGGGGGTGGIGQGGAGGEGRPPAIQMHRLSLGGGHGCRANLDGTITCWGNNSHGQLGNQSTGGTLPPVLVSDINDAIGVATGTLFSCARHQTGNISCWGNNSTNQLGGAGDDANAPVPVAVSNAVGLGSGSSSMCVLRGNGTLWCWGDMSDLGTQCTPPNCGLASPQQYVTGASLISRGSSGSCALLAGQGIWCAGVGITNTLTNVAGLARAFLRGCALGTDGHIHCWQASNTPELIPNINDAAAVSTGFSFRCAIRSDRSVWCSGENSQGELGNGTDVDSDVPTQTVTIAGAVAISTRDSSTCALLADDSVWCWGNGESSPTQTVAP